MKTVINPHLQAKKRIHQSIRKKKLQMRMLIKSKAQ